MMRESKAARYCENINVDRLSELPDALLCHIMYFLPTKNAVATSILAKRWKFLWKYVPKLLFDTSLEPPESTFYGKGYPEIALSNNKYASIVRKVLRLNKVVPLDTFSLIYSLGLNDSYLDEFVCKAIARGVKNLEISRTKNSCSRIKFGKFGKGDKLPKSLFISENLVSLRIHGCCLNIPTTAAVSLFSLKDLYLDEIDFGYYDENTIHRLISGCPVLEKLTLRHYPPGSCWTNVPMSLLNNKSLVSLSIHGFSMCIPTDATDTISLLSLKELCLDEIDYSNTLNSIHELVSCCPVLEKLTIKQVEMQHFRQWKIFSRTLKYLNVELYLNEDEHDYFSDSSCDSNSFESEMDCYLFDKSEWLKWKMETPSLISFHLRFKYITNYSLHLPFICLENISSIKSLKFHCDSINIDSRHRDYMGSTGEFLNLEKLDFSSDWWFLFKILENAGNLKDLIIHHISNNHLVIPKLVPKCMVTHLERVSFVGYDFSKKELKMVNYLLKNALALKKITLCCFHEEYKYTFTSLMSKIEEVKKLSHKIEYHVHEVRPRGIFLCCDKLL